MRINEITERNRGWSGLQSVYPASQTDFDDLVEYIRLLQGSPRSTINASMPIIEEFIMRIDKFLSVSWPDEDDQHIDMLRKSMQQMRNIVTDMISKL